MKTYKWSTVTTVSPDWPLISRLHAWWHLRRWGVILLGEDNLPIADDNIVELIRKGGERSGN